MVSEGTVSSVSYVNDISPIIEQSCSGTSCHSAATAIGSRYDFVSNEGSALKSASVSRINDGTMPPSSSGKSISADKRQLIIDFIGSAEQSP